MKSRSRGVALIVALLVVALATVLIAGLLDRGELAHARTRNSLREAQAQSYALGLEAYAAKVLVQDQARSSGADSADSPRFGCPAVLSGVLGCGQRPGSSARSSDELVFDDR